MVLGEGTAFDASFEALTRDAERAGRGYAPMHWQRRLYDAFVSGRVPSALDLPTGFGKTSVMALWLIARANGARLPRRLVYVVDRRAVVDQATEEAIRLRGNLNDAPELVDMRAMLGLGRRALPISTLRGQFVDNKEWLADPAVPAIIIGTVDMIGSRLLFSGYGVSPRMRPYHAGLLGADALVVLDEAHLVPSFAHLVRAVERDFSLRARAAADRERVPPLVFLPLSATQREIGEERCGCQPFRLTDADRTDTVAAKRLGARKRLRLEPLREKDPDRQLAEVAWALATKDGRVGRVVVFCHRRERQEEGGGPSAQGVKETIEELGKADRKSGRAQRAHHPVELLVGARRVYERESVADRLRTRGFIGAKGPLDKPAFLVATAAGEVGVDIDADHMVADMVAWERLVQRLGRVNRRGDGNAEIVVFQGKPKKPEAPTDPERRAAAAKSVIERLPHIGEAFDASPGALRALADHARDEVALAALIEAATTPEPLRPALNRALLDAWSMTSLDVHTGRPEVAPWLRGWVEDDRQTTLVWRRYLPVRDEIADWPHTRADETEIEEFFEAAPPHQSEKLETDSWRVADWLQNRAKQLIARERAASEAVTTEPGFAAEPMPDGATETADAASEPPAEAASGLRKSEIAALLLSPGGAYAGRYTLEDLGRERKGDAWKNFVTELTGKLIVADARFCGVKDGLLVADTGEPPKTADHTPDWHRIAQFRVRPRQSSEGAPGSAADSEWRFEHEFVVRRDTEGNAQAWLVVEHLREAARKEDARSVSRPQELSEHQDWVRREMVRIANGVGLSGVVAEALALAALLHDEGKRAARWQRAFNAIRDVNQYGLSGPLAKTRGPINQALLDGYRHEFGSLAHVERSSKFQELPDDMRDLVLHLVAAHHGFARPVIETRGCEDAPPSVLQRRAGKVALRFARLQKRWGPWGLGWLEALLRAADQQASRDNDERPALSRTGVL